jgi:hypothetical protein
VERETRHNPRLDDEMKKEVASITHGSPTDSRAEEFREAEPPVDGDAGVDFKRDETLPLTKDGPSPVEFEERSELARWLNPSAFPGDRQSLIDAAKENQAPDSVLEKLSRLPEGKYENVNEVWTALGGREESRF